MENIKLFEYDAVVVGSGAAGYNTACRIKEFAKKSVCIVTEGKNIGTSRNTGSDKQTYYKLGLGGSAPDSIRRMAEDLFSGGAVDGDNALCEAALSTRCFFNLCESGVPFPSNRYGEYVGYKTDHDPCARATSAGPLTSKFMTEALEKKAEVMAVKIYDDLMAVEILKKNDIVCGLLCVDMNSGEYTAFKCPNIVLATGGPAGIYYDSVYPECHNGSTGLAVSVGASLQNMTEWQYGLASVSPRWNVSGTYMQVLPRFVSVDEKGNEYEFLGEFFGDVYECLSNVFMKGYQWPFDIKKVKDGSSVIDLLVYIEKVYKNRRVCLDFTKNPLSLDNIDFKRLSKEAYTYLQNAGATFGTPIERLEKMNAPAIELYLGKGIDIRKDYLEIALCAQHNNGGIAVDKWWQTSVKGLFAVGECAGTHGISRPGGSALNAGQVGGLRAAQFISEKTDIIIDKNDFGETLKIALDRNSAFIENALSLKPKYDFDVDFAIENAKMKMSAVGGAIRDKEKMIDLLCETNDFLSRFGDLFGISADKDVYKLYILKDILTVQSVVLTAMIDYSKKVGVSRGSALYTNREGFLREGLSEDFRFVSDIERENRDKIQKIKCSCGIFEVSWRVVRPIPEEDTSFEIMWEKYRKNKNIF